MDFSQDISTVLNELENLESEIKGSIDRKRNSSFVQSLNADYYGVSDSSYSNPPSSEGGFESSTDARSENSRQLRPQKNEQSHRSGNERKKQKKSSKTESQREIITVETSPSAHSQIPAQATDYVLQSLPLVGNILLDDFKRGFIMSEILGPPLSRKNIANL